MSERVVFAARNPAQPFLCRQMCLCTRWVSLSFSLLHFNVGLGHFADYPEVNKQREGLCRVAMSVYNR